jgi:hypothetical protein
VYLRRNFHFGKAVAAAERKKYEATQWQLRSIKKSISAATGAQKGNLCRKSIVSLFLKHKQHTHAHYTTHTATHQITVRPESSLF